MKPLIAVCGSDGDDPELSVHALHVAESVGRLIAKKGGVLVCGGRGGVMRAACKGVKEAQGITVGLLPESKEEANEFVDIGILTRMGNMRNFLVVSAGDVVIAICGRWGTFNELSYAMILNKPVILILGTGGSTDALASGKILPEIPASFYCVSTAEEAVEKAFSLCSVIKE